MINMRNFICFLLVISSAFANIVVYNSTAADCSNGCSLLDNSIWEGNQAPQYNDTVIINSSTTITIFLNGSTVALNTLNISGPVTFWLLGGAYFNYTINNVTWVLTTLNLDSETTLLVEESTMMAQGNVELAIINHSSIGGMLFNYLSVTSLYATNSTLYSTFECNLLNVTNSIISSYYVSANYFYAYDNVTFTYASPTVSTLASFNNNPNLLINSMHINGTLEINDCVTTVWTLFFDSPTASATFSASDPSFTASLYNVGRGIFIFNDNMQVFFYDGVSYLQLTTGNNVSLTFLDTIYPSSISSFQTINTVNINVFGHLYLVYNGSLDANVNVSSSGYLGIGDAYGTAAWITMVPNYLGVCTVYGGGLYLYESISSFTCRGVLTINNVFLNGMLSVLTLNTTKIQVENPASITGTVIVQNGPGLRIYDTSLTVNGPYTQTNGTFNCSASSSVIPVFLLASSIQMNQVNAFLDLGWSLAQSKTTKVTLATAGAVQATFPSVQDLFQITFKVAIESDSKGIYAVYTNIYNNNNPSFLSQYWYFGIIGISVAFIFTGVFVVQYIRRRQRHFYQPVA